jgi:hypothetical protein
MLCNVLRHHGVIHVGFEMDKFGEVQVFSWYSLADTDHSVAPSSKQGLSGQRVLVLVEDKAFSLLGKPLDYKWTTYFVKGCLWSILLVAWIINDVNFSTT